MTLNELIDDILLEARNNQITESEKLSRYQIELWIKTYRAYLLKQKLDKELPTLLGTKLTTSVITVKDAYGNIIQLGSETKMKFQKYRKYTCKDYIAYVKGNRIYVEGDANQLEYIDVEIIAEDPTEDKLCYNPDKDEYPLPAYMWGTVKQLIFTKDFLTMRQQVSDTTNDSKDDTQNVMNQNVNRSIRR